MLKAVYEFNKIRNSFSYDEELEVSMYKEEVKEFFDATTTAERLDALVDCGYVRYGTMMKRAFNGLDDTLPYEKTPESLMISILLEEIPKPIFDEVLRTAEGIVADCNAVKPKVLIDGKVSKDKHTPNATEQIEVMLNTAIEIYYKKIDKQNERIMSMEDN